MAIKIEVSERNQKKSPASDYRAGPSVILILSTLSVLEYHLYISRGVWSQIIYHYGYRLAHFITIIISNSKYCLICSCRSIVVRYGKAISDLAVAEVQAV